MDEPWPAGAVPMREYFEAILEEHRRAILIAEEEREKAAVVLREATNERIVIGDEALERHIAEQVKQIKAALEAQEKFSVEVQRASKEAVERALEAQKEIAHKHNEQIDQQDRDKEKFATKVDLAHLREVISKTNEELRLCLPREMFDRTTELSAAERTRISDGLAVKIGRTEFETATMEWSVWRQDVEARLNVQRGQSAGTTATIGQVIVVITVVLTVIAILVGAFV